MNYDDLLFIGGPKDGQVIPVRKGQVIVDVPALSEPDCMALTDLATPPEKATTFDVIRYRREWLYDIDGAMVHVMVAIVINNPMQRLVAGYKPTPLRR